MNRRHFLSLLAAIVVKRVPPPFASGRIVPGKWFSNFGPGMAAMLHGMEAVVTPQQAPAFAMDVLAGKEAIAFNDAMLKASEFARMWGVR